MNIHKYAVRIAGWAGSAIGVAAYAPKVIDDGLNNWITLIESTKLLRMEYIELLF